MNRIASIVASAVAASGSLGVASGEPPATTRPAAAGRYSAQAIVLPGGAGAAVAITDREDGKLYIYEMDEKSLTLRETVDLTAAGQPTIEPVRIGPATVPVAATRPAEPAELTIFLNDKGELSNPVYGYSLAAADLPVFAKDVAAGRRVVVMNRSDMPLSQLIAARDRLRAAGVTDATVHHAPDDPDERNSTTVKVSVRKDGGFRLGGFIDRAIILDDDLPLFAKELLGGRAVEVSPTDGDVTLTQLVQARDRLKAAGIERVTFAGQAKGAGK